MKYNSDEQKIINKWLTSVGAPYLVDEDFFEYKDGQLLEIAKAKEDSLLTWDEWQHLQTMMDMEIPLKMSIRFVGILWENDIVKDKHGNLYKAFWQNNYYQFSWICVKSDVFSIGTKWDLWSFKSFEIEVIGNIFDNPELLEV